jgi:phospholipid/cholesterol/gamma-HCH transport system permease protein
VVRALDQLADSFGTSTREAIEQLGSISVFFWNVVRVVPRLLLKFHLLVEQLMRIGVNSLSLIALISIAIGAITVWQAKYMFQDVIPYTYLGVAVGKAILIDLGPVLTALVITGRVGAMIAAELGTMKVTEQCDAMTVLSLDPYVYLLAPRVLAGFIMMPVLGIFSSFMAIVAGQILASLALGVNPYTFYNSIKLMFRFRDVIVMLVKSFIFGGVIALAGTYYGYLTVGGAVGVGRSTNRAVVAASVLILIMNLIVVVFLL